MTTDALDLRVPLDVGPDHTLRIVAGADWLNANDRRHWSQGAALVRQWRVAAGWAARAAKVPRMERAYVLAELRFTHARRRDPANWYPTVKATVDGLVDVGVLNDDSADHLVGPDLRLGTPGVSALILHVWRLA